MIAGLSNESLIRTGLFEREAGVHFAVVNDHSFLAKLLPDFESVIWSCGDVFRFVGKLVLEFLSPTVFVSIANPRAVGVLMGFAKIKSIGPSGTLGSYGIRDCRDERIECSLHVKRPAARRFDNVADLSGFDVSLLKPFAS